MGHIPVFGLADHIAQRLGQQLVTFGDPGGHLAGGVECEETDRVIHDRGTLFTDAVQPLADEEKARLSQGQSLACGPVGVSALALVLVDDAGLRDITEVFIGK